MAEVVKYKNELNTIPMRNFNSVELDLFFAICSKMKNKGLDEVTFNFEDLKKLSNYKPTATKRFANDLDKVYNKMLQLTYREEHDGIRKRFVLFTGYEINENEQYVNITLNSNLEYILNKFSSEFTQFELREFTLLSSSYAKSMYRLLKQWRSTGNYIVKIEDFKELLNIPKSYQSSDIDKRVLDPILNELSPFFKNLEVIKNKKKGRGRGGVLTGYTFTFQAEKTDKWVEGKFKKQQPQTRKETLPEWVGKELTETPMAEEEQAKLRQQLADMRSKSPNINEKHP